MHIWFWVLCRRRKGGTRVFPRVGQLCQKELLYEASLLTQSDSGARTKTHMEIDNLLHIFGFEQEGEGFVWESVQYEYTDARWVANAIVQELH